MAGKKIKYKKSFIVLIMIIVFFVLYFTSFFITSNKAITGDKSEGQESQVQEQEQQQPQKREEDKTPLIEQIRNSKKVYITDNKSGYMRIDATLWDDFKNYFDDFKKVRNPEIVIKSAYRGHTDDGVKFETDLNYFKAYNVKNDEYYKIPVNERKEFDNLLKKLMYTSFDFASDYKNWKEVTVSDGKTTKKVRFWWKKDFAESMQYKRVVGKVQPEKEFERTKRNFTIKIKNDTENIEIITMGKDYIKVTVAGQTAYYEVYDSLYKYLNNEALPLEKDSK